MTARLLILSATTMAALAGVGAVMLTHDQRQRQLAERIADLVTPLVSAHGHQRPASRRTGLDESLAAWQARFAWLSGYRPDRRPAYPLSAPLLLLLAGLPAFTVERLVSRLSGVPIDLALPLIWLLCTRTLFRLLHARHADKLYRQLPDTLSMIVRSVRAGIPLHEALRGVARESMEPTAQLFVRVVDQMSIGMRLDEALREAASRSGLAEYGFFAVALTLQAQTGGSLAETLESLAEVIRKRVALRQRAVALASEARTSAYVLAALPVVTGCALSVLNYAYISPLFETASGKRILFLAIGLLLTAGVAMRIMIKRSLR